MERTLVPVLHCPWTAFATMLFTGKNDWLGLLLTANKRTFEHGIQQIHLANAIYGIDTKYSVILQVPYVQDLRMVSLLWKFMLLPSAIAKGDTGILRGEGPDDVCDRSKFKIRTHAKKCSAVICDIHVSHAVAGRATTSTPSQSGSIRHDVASAKCYPRRYM